jgi:hypothetical protein
LSWMCIGTAGCPTSVPATGDPCNNLTGVACDYRGNPHLVCVCQPGADAGSSPTWTCVQSAACPATPPPYDLSTTCPVPAICSYPSSPSHCECLQTGTPWVCSFGYFPFGS